MVVKYLLFIFLVVSFSSCRTDHKMLYEIEVTYSDHRKEILKGEKVIPMMERVKTLDVEMKRKNGTVCACVTNGVWCKELIACDIIKMDVLKKDEVFDKSIPWFVWVLGGIILLIIILIIAVKMNE